MSADRLSTSMIAPAQGVVPVPSLKPDRQYSQSTYSMLFFSNVSLPFLDLQLLVPYPSDPPPTAGVLLIQQLTQAESYTPMMVLASTVFPNTQRTQQC